MTNPKLLMAENKAVLLPRQVRAIEHVQKQQLNPLLGAVNHNLTSANTTSSTGKATPVHMLPPGFNRGRGESLELKGQHQHFSMFKPNLDEITPQSCYKIAHKNIVNPPLKASGCRQIAISNAIAN